MSPPLLRLTDIVAGPPASPWLGPISLTVGAGEMVAVLGPNGAGKSTLLNVVMGLARPTSGRVMLGEAPLLLGDPSGVARQGVGLAPEGRRVFPGLTVNENLLTVSDEGRAARRSRMEEIYALFPALTARRRTEGWRLSGGEQQMLAIGRALMRRPRLLLLDEPSLGLAPMTAAALFEAIDLIRAEGVAILLAEQNIGHALRRAGRAVILGGGRIRAEGAPADLGDPASIAARYFS